LPTLPSKLTLFLLYAMASPPLTKMDGIKTLEVFIDHWREIKKTEGAVVTVGLPEDALGEPEGSI